MNFQNERETLEPPPRKFGDWAFAKINPDAKFPGRKVDRLKNYQVKDTPVFDIQEKVWRYTFGRTSFTEHELVTQDEFDTWYEKKEATPTAGGGGTPSTPTPSSSKKTPMSSKKTPVTLGTRKATPTTNLKKKKTRRGEPCLVCKPFAEVLHRTVNVNSLPW